MQCTTIGVVIPLLALMDVSYVKIYKTIADVASVFHMPLKAGSLTNIQLQKLFFLTLPKNILNIPVSPEFSL